MPSSWVSRTEEEGRQWGVYLSLTDSIGTPEAEVRSVIVFEHEAHVDGRLRFMSALRSLVSSHDA